jgi:hypothetical protein
MMADDLIRAMSPYAARLVCAVVEWDQAESHRILLGLNTDELRALAVILAASVDPDRPLGVIKAEETAGTVGRIVICVSDATGVDVQDIYSQDRSRYATDARHVACWVASALGMKSTHIGRAIHRDHSSVLNGVDRVTRTPNLLRVAQHVLEDIQKRQQEAA